MKNRVRYFYILASFFIYAVETHASDASNYVKMAAKTHGVPQSFALRIAKLESGVKCGVHNRASGATGPMQILPSTARTLGYRNIRGASCATQVNAGMKYLSYCLRITRHDLFRAAKCYTGGPGALKSRNSRAHKYAVRATR